MGLKEKYSDTNRRTPCVSSICEVSVAHSRPEEYVAEIIRISPGSSFSTGSPSDSPKGGNPFFCTAAVVGKWKDCVSTTTALKSKFGLAESRELVLVTAQTATVCSVVLTKCELTNNWV